MRDLSPDIRGTASSRSTRSGFENAYYCKGRYDGYDVLKYCAQLNKSTLHGGRNQIRVELLPRSNSFGPFPLVASTLMRHMRLNINIVFPSKSKTVLFSHTFLLSPLLENLFVLMLFGSNYLMHSTALRNSFPYISQCHVCLVCVLALLAAST